MALKTPPSLWDSKPWWCQPWSIILTGLIIPTVAWILSHRLWFVIPIGLGILGWWFLFLVLVPKNYTEYMQTSHTPSDEHQIGSAGTTKG